MRIVYIWDKKALGPQTLKLMFAGVLVFSLISFVSAQDFTEEGGVESFSTDDYSVSTGEVRSGVDWLELNGSVSGLSDLNDSIRMGFEYREEGSSDWSEVFAEDLDSDGSFDRRVEGLDNGTDYEFRAVSLEHDREGSVSSKETLPGVFSESGGVESFSTDDYSISTSEQTEAGTDWLNVRGEVSGIDSELEDPINLYFEYRKKGDSSWNSVDTGSRTNNGFFEKRIEGLDNGTSYEYRAYSEHDKQGEVLEKETLPGVFTISGGVESFATGTLFNVTVDDINSPVVEGEDLEVEALVENVGADGSDTVELDVPGLGSDTREVDLDSGESELVDLNVSTGSGDGGSYTANVSGSDDYDTQDFDVASLEPPISPQPGDDSENVGLDENLGVEANASGDIEMSVDFMVNGSPVGGGLVDNGERIEVSPELEPGEHYEWNATASYGSEKKESQIFNFSTVERPEVTSVEPVDGAVDVDKNPELNVTVDGSSDVNVSIYNYDGDILMHEEEVGPRSTVSFDASDSDEFGGDLTNRWWVGLESLGAEWNNSENPYNFSVSEIGGVSYNLQEFEDGWNLNPGDFGGLEVVGPEALRYRVSNSRGIGGMSFRFNLSNSTASDTLTFTDIDSGEVLSVNVSDFDVDIEENTEGYEIYGYYMKGESEYKQDEFSSNVTGFSTYVGKINWTHSGEDVQEFRILYNGSYVPPEEFGYVGSVGSEKREVGVANRRLQSDSSKDCYQVEAWNPFGSSYAELENPEDNCLGSDSP